MKAKFYTVMVVPHRGSRMRSFIVSRSFVLVAGFLAAALILGGVLVPRMSLTNAWNHESLASLRQHTAALTEERHQVAGQMAELRHRIEFYEHQARKFALIAGLNDLPQQMLATGGALPVPADDGLQQEMEALSLREQRLTENFTALAAAYDKREDYLAVVPSISPVREGYFGSTYGWRKDPFTGQRTFHQGLDIVANTGTPVVAPAPGKISRAGRMGGLGLAVYMNHSNDMVSRFGHLSKIVVKSGQKVDRGDVIGYVGSTGRSLGSHLHYELVVSGTRVDPRDFIIEEPRPPLDS